MTVFGSCQNELPSVSLLLGERVKKFASCRLLVGEWRVTGPRKGHCYMYAIAFSDT